MRRVHAVKISGKSPFKTHPPKGGERWFEKVVGRLASQGDLSEGICRCIQEFVTQTFVAFSPRLKNVLCHCDVGPQNHIYTPDGRIVLLDWDLAERGNLFRDFAVVLLDVKEMARLGKVAEVRQSIQRAFLRGYGEMGFTPQEIERLIDAHHVICLVYNTLAFLETEKNSKQEKRNMAQIRKILQKYS